MPIKVNFSISGRLVRYVLLFTVLVMASVMTFAVWDRQSLLFPVALWTLFLLDVLWVVWFENLGIKITEKRVTFATARRIGSIMYDDVEKIEFSFLPKSDFSNILQHFQVSTSMKT